MINLIQSIPQSASDTQLRTPMAAISHFALLGFKPEKSKNLKQEFSLGQELNISDNCFFLSVSMNGTS